MYGRHVLAMGANVVFKPANDTHANWERTQSAPNNNKNTTLLKCICITVKI